MSHRTFLQDQYDRLYYFPFHGVSESVIHIWLHRTQEGLFSTFIQPKRKHRLLSYNVCQKSNTIRQIPLKQKSGRGLLNGMKNKSCWTTVGLT